MSFKDDPSYRKPNFGWDLPPGCRLSDIPGNRPEDEEIDVTINLTLTKGMISDLVCNGLTADNWDEIRMWIIEDIQKQYKLEI